MLRERRGLGELRFLPFTNNLDLLGPSKVDSDVVAVAEFEDNVMLIAVLISREKVALVYISCLRGDSYEVADSGSCLPKMF